MFANRKPLIALRGTWFVEYYSRLLWYTIRKLETRNRCLLNLRVIVGRERAERWWCWPVSKIERNQSISGDVGRIRHSFCRTFPTVRIFGMLVPTRSVEIVRVLLLLSHKNGVPTSQMNRTTTQDLIVRVMRVKRHTTEWLAECWIKKTSITLSLSKPLGKTFLENLTYTLFAPMQRHKYQSCLATNQYW